MKNTIFKGGIILIVAGILGKVLGAIYRIPLSNVLGAEGIGLYQMVFSVFSVVLILSSGGISASVAHNVAKIRAGAGGSEKNVLFKALGFSFFASLFFALVFLIFGGNIAALQGAPDAKIAYQMAALALLFSSLLAPFRGLTQGHQNMAPTAISQTLEQVFKLIFGLSFAYLFSMQGAAMGVFGAFLGLGIAEIIAFAYLLLSARKIDFSGSGYVQGFWKSNFSITASSLVIPLVLLFDSFVVVNILSWYMSVGVATALYGLQSGVVSSLINFPVVISVSLSLALLPQLSFNLSQKNFAAASQNLSSVFMVMLFILVPCALVLFFFGGEVILVLYPALDGALLATASTLLQISAVQIVFISFLQVSVSVFQSLGKAQIPIFILLGAGVVKAVLTVLLVAAPQINIFGVAASNVVFYGISAALGLGLAKKFVPFALPEKSLLFLAISFAALSASFLLINVYFQSLVAKIFFAGISGLVLYILPIFYLDFFGIKTALLKRKML